VKASQLPLPDPAQAIERWVGANPVWSRVTAQLTRYAVPVYMVGGSVRDALCGVKGQDLDLAVDGKAIDLGRALADALGAAFYVMDREHDVCRVIVQHEGSRHHVDLAGLRAQGILADLAARDLTLNAMGISLARPWGPLLDPTGGLEDLATGTVRHAYARAFIDDPVRLLRAARVAADMHFHLHPATRELLLQQRELLANASRERVRDELLRLLLAPQAAGICLAQDLGLLQIALAPLTATELAGGIALLGALLEHLREPTIQRLSLQWSQAYTTGHTRGQMVALAALVSQGSTEHVRVALASLRLSDRERSRVLDVLGSWGSPSWQEYAHIDPLTAHRYYRRWGSGGADGAALVAVGHGTSASGVAAAERMLGFWLDHQAQVIAPQPLLTGRELVQDLGLAPGAQVGETLRILTEHQVQGLISSPGEALALARRLVSEFTTRQV
jgi:hypothetical protein